MENLRGSLLMTAAMLGFAIEDMLIKLLTATVPLGLVLLMIGAGGALVFGTLALLRGDKLLSRDLLARSVLIRNTGELIGTVGFVTAIALTPLSSASAILQATPLVVTLGAALFLGEQVGWRRWSAILVGFAGVLLIIRPGFDAFEPLSLFALLGVAGLAVRDLATRTVPRAITSLQLSAYAFAITVPAGFGILAFTGDSLRMLHGVEWLMIGAALGCGVLAYSAIVAAMRMGDVAVITPYRYSRLVFALIFGVVFFAEEPDLATLTGSALIVASGIYTFWRELRLRRLATRAAQA
ncbi:MAG: DMT family transporter [Rhodobacterales bacterium]